jgi:hypothetical protein
MPWWGWALIVVTIIVMPLKLKIWKQMLSKNSKTNEDA